MAVTVYPSRDFSARVRTSDTLVDGRLAMALEVAAERRLIELHRAPGDGGYRDVTRATGAAESVSVLAFPDVFLRLAEIFA